MTGAARAAARPMAPGGGAIGGTTILALILLSATAWSAAALYFASSHGHLDFGRHAIGRDFVIVWTASHMVAEGHALQVFQPERFLSAAHRLFDPALPYHIWVYPPTALFNILPLGRLDYFPAYLLWNAVGFAALAAGARSLLGRSLTLWVLLSPAVAVNLVMGQNGFLTASLLFAGFAALKRQPNGAGALFGLLGFKPQMGLLLPVALVAGRRWRTILAAAVIGTGMAGASAAVFGVEAWRVFVELTLPAHGRLMVGTGPIRWMTPSPFMSGLILTGAPQGAILTQLPFTGLGVWLAWRAFRRAGDLQLSAGLVFVATFLASPQSFNYDMIPVAAAALLLAKRSRAPVDGVLAALLWIGPLAVMLLNARDFPIMPLLLAAAGLRMDRALFGATSLATPAVKLAAPLAADA